ncbi:phosphonate C-P lyase system protein PhnH [Pseudooceanicola sp. CBS1P-1]|uniref:Phosphonate C-P lyase system protein PhnH n=1 Tax=Pseudooceanicola albus TaxID=2692189 RepID=A0A6L7G2U2_9RHOB|nr:MULTISPECIES: phosphonate C-P lyase system protein PhnH [Pseudooceanicola]MBT9382351.1 phosphonate C-P lyase system protein PhnH [Pseudooceanicola endophyticus]MXN16893.1 phosphonate C-P lyase system protein PhnH [Pseudooceanicola albus]
MESTTETLGGGFDDAPRQAARAFRAALEAMARPGQLQQLGEVARAPAPCSPAAATLLLVLCDPETPVFLAGAHDSAAMRDWLRFHTGAPLVETRVAAVFALGTAEALAPLSDFAVGVPEYPDRSATLIIDGWASAHPVRLSGPGLREARAAELPMPEAFRANAARFPLGWDAYFTRADSLWALPRSTRIRMEGS